MATNKIDVAAEVRAALARQNMSQRQLAVAVGVTQPVMWRRLRGEVEFSGALIQDIAEVLHVPVGQLFGETPVSESMPVGPRVEALSGEVTR